MSKYTVLRNRNDWLSNYKGQTFNAKLNEELFKGVISEHAKYKSGNKNFTEQLGKKCLVTCIDPTTMELESIGSSSLIRDEKTGKIFDNLILDNFGLWFALSIGFMSGAPGAFKDDGGGSQTIDVYTGGFAFNEGTGPTVKILMGSGSTVPTRADFKIQTTLPTSPESVYVQVTGGGYTANNTVIYQGDYTTGGTGTVREAGTFGHWDNSSNSVIDIMLTHDAVSPAVVYTAGKLLRAAYIWTI